jgi:secreted PhoX family phosphatase
MDATRASGTASENGGEQPQLSEALAVSRRSLLGSGLLGGAALLSAGTAGSCLLGAGRARAEETRAQRTRRGRSSDYGPLRPTPDQNGEAILALPAGFSYVSFSKTGDPLPGGAGVPALHDGMAAFAAGRNRVRLIRNHELNNPAGEFRFGVQVPPELAYDERAAGGCFTLDFDTRRKQVVRQFASLGGTLRNCAGGYAYRDTGWISSEETTVGPAQGFAQKHGYCFLVPAGADSAVRAVPLRGLGRFSHEAAVADSRGLIYETEDDGPAGFYRFTPSNPRRLTDGGLLQILGVQGDPSADLAVALPVGLRLPVRWIDIAQPDPDLEAGAPRVFVTGRAAGAAAFNRLEGIFRGQDGDSIYFVSTRGGVGFGQLWHYVPRGEGGELVLVYQSPLGSVLDSPDNICVTPGGAVLFCEDDASNDGDTHPLAPGLTNVNRLIGLGHAGESFEFAVNIASDSEFAGAVFSPDGEVLFVNVQGDREPGTGMTLAIWGPWAHGPF